MKVVGGYVIVFMGGFGEEKGVGKLIDIVWGNFCFLVFYGLGDCDKEGIILIDMGKWIFVCKVWSYIEIFNSFREFRCEFYFVFWLNNRDI